MSYLGIDIGTGACKAVTFTGDGDEIASAHREYPLLHPDDRQAELDSRKVLDSCFEVIREVNAATGDPVRAMAISSQGEAMTPVGEEGTILGNAMVSTDTRAEHLVAPFSKEFGEEALYRVTGHTPHTLFSLYKLLWVKEHQPDVWKKARYFLCFEDLLQWKLGLRPRISWPLAGRTMLFDVRKHVWSGEILAAIGLEADRLAEPVPSGQVVGVIGPGTGRQLGFRNEVLVVAGGHDQTCAALGAGVVKPRLCMYATGSVECFCPMFEKPVFSDRLRMNNLCCYDFTVRGAYTTVAYSLTGGNILRWARDELGYEERILAERSGGNAYQLLLDKMPGDPTGLLVLPYFSATGTPYFDTRAKGALIGLQLTTRKGEMIKALLEGVALEMKLNLQLMEETGMEVDTLVATGGGTGHHAWNQLKADVLDRKVIVREVREAGCFGAAMLAQGAHLGSAVQQLAREDRRERYFEPDPGKSRIYREKFEHYRQLYPVLKKLQI